MGQTKARRILAKEALEYRALRRGIASKIAGGETVPTFEQEQLQKRARDVADLAVAFFEDEEENAFIRKHAQEHTP